MGSRQVLVAGATGRIGSRVVGDLLRRGLRPRALVREPARAAALPPGVVAVVGDLEDRASLGPAVDGVDALLVLSPLHPRQEELQGHLVHAAAAAGGPLVVKISGLATAPDSFVDSGRWHAGTERQIRELGLPFTFLRPCFLMQNLALQLPGARSEGVVRAGVGDARIAMVDARDVAEVAARLLAGEVDRRGETLDLTGPRALDYAQVASAIGEALGRRVRYEPLDAHAARRRLEATGMPGWRVQVLLHFDRAFRRGLGAVRSRAVEQVLDRPPRPLSAYLEEAVREA